MASPRKSNLELLRQALAGRSGAEEFYAVLDEKIEWKVVRFEWYEDAAEALEQ